MLEINTPQRMNLEILQSNPALAKDITLQISGENLLSFADRLVSESRKETARRLKEAAKPDIYLTRDEVAKILNVSLTTLFHWNNKGILTTRKIGNKVRYLRKDIDKVLNKA